MKLRIEISRKELRAGKREGARILEGMSRAVLAFARQMPTALEGFRKIYGREFGAVMADGCPVTCRCAACSSRRGDVPTAVPDDAPAPPPDAIGYIPAGYIINVDGFVVPSPAGTEPIKPAP